MHKIFVRLDTDSHIIDVASSAFLTDTEGWTLYDEGDGDRFAHALNYFSTPLRYPSGAYRYKYLDAGISLELPDIAVTPSTSVHMRVSNLEDAFDMILSEGGAVDG